MKIYVVKNDSGEYWDYDDERWNTSAAGDYANSKAGAEDAACRHGGHVVKLVEKPELVEVNEEEAEMLEQAKCNDDPAELIVGFVNSRDNYDDDRKAEERLMRAYVIGWTVEKPKRYVVYQILPGSHIGDDAIQAIKHTDNTSAVAWMFAESANLGKFSDRLFTDAEIKHYGLQDCEKVEVTE